MQSLFLRVFDLVILVRLEARTTPVRFWKRLQLQQEPIHLQPVVVFQDFTVMTVTSAHRYSPDLKFPRQQSSCAARRTKELETSLVFGLPTERRSFLILLPALTDRTDDFGARASRRVALSSTRLNWLWSVHGAGDSAVAVMSPARVQAGPEDARASPGTQIRDGGFCDGWLR